MTDLTKATPEELAEKVSTFCFARLVDERGEAALSELVTRLTYTEKEWAGSREGSRRLAEQLVAAEKERDEVVKANVTLVREGHAAMDDKVAAEAERDEAQKIARSEMALTEAAVKERDYYKKQRDVAMDDLRTAKTRLATLTAALEEITKRRPDEFDPYTAAIHDVVRIARAALQEETPLPDDPNTEDWLGIKSQFTEES